MDLPEIIPCLDEIEEWEYQFPKVIDPEGDDMLFDISCPGLPFDQFVFEIQNDVVRLILNTAPSFLPIHGSHSCNLKVLDSQALTLSTIL
jgi:hypothetical protein